MAHLETFIAWLRDAYAMERALVGILESQAKGAAEYPEVESKVREHAERTRRQAELVKGCVEKLGGTVSAAKTGFAKLVGNMTNLGTKPLEDAIVKNAITDFAVENFEIACYRSLIAAARELGHEEIATVCEQILREEEEMALWLQDRIAVLTRDHLLKVGAHP